MSFVYDFQGTQCPHIKFNVPQWSAVRFFQDYFFFSAGLLRLQNIYQTLRPGNGSFQVESVKRILNSTDAIDFLRSLEELDRWGHKYVVLDCPTDMAKDVVIGHVRDVALGKRTYHYLLSGLVSKKKYI